MFDPSILAKTAVKAKAATIASKAGVTEGMKVAAHDPSIVTSKGAILSGKTTAVAAKAVKTSAHMGVI